MGSRGAFVNVNNGNFSFVENGQRYSTIGQIGDIQILSMGATKNVKAPEYSHSSNRVYVTMKDGKIKHISFYDDNHKQIKVIDFEHSHHGIKPHIHYNLDHTDKGIALSQDDKDLIKKIKRRL